MVAHQRAARVHRQVPHRVAQAAVAPLQVARLRGAHHQERAVVRVLHHHLLQAQAVAVPVRQPAVHQAHHQVAGVTPALTILAAVPAPAPVQHGDVSVTLRLPALQVGTGTTPETT